MYAVGVLLAAVALAQCGSSSPTARPVDTDTAANAATAREWRSVAGPSFATDASPALVESGGEVVAFGATADAPVTGAVVAVPFDPTTRTFTASTPAPFTDVPTDLAAVAVGRRVVVAGVECAQPNDPDDCPTGAIVTAVYDTSAHSWQALRVPSGPEFSAGPSVGGLTAAGALGGSAVFVAARRDGHTKAVTETFLAVDLSTGAWTSLGDPGLPGQLIAVCATDAGIIAVGSHDLLNGRPVSPGPSPVDPAEIKTAGPDVEKYDAATASWQSPRRAASLQVNESGFQIACWPGGLIAYGAAGKASPLRDVALHLEPSALSWGTLAPPAGLSVSTEHAWTGHELLLWGEADPGIRPSFAYDPSTGRWSNEPPGPLASTEIGTDGVSLAYEVTQHGAGRWFVNGK